jgi:2-amino-4-hydroxy-6-hydroxymethyldihydropteridine diphosphokinase
MKAVLSLGSNLGDRLANLRGGVAALDGLDGVEISRVSSVYETEPDGVAQQPDYLNIAVVADCGLAPLELLTRTQEIERNFGRLDKGGNKPRTLDIDLVQMGTGVLDVPGLQLPHPRAAARAFVLIPWLEIDPEASLPGSGPVRELPAAQAGAGIRKVEPW